jgi:hypothetical protein
LSVFQQILWGESLIFTSELRIIFFETFKVSDSIFILQWNMNLDHFYSLILLILSTNQLSLKFKSWFIFEFTFVKLIDIGVYSHIELILPLE